MARLNRLDEDEVLTVRTYKTIPNTQIAWANTYEVIVDNPTQDPSEASAKLESLKNVFVQAERGLLNSLFLLDRIVISTYVPDGVPYDPFSFVSYTISLPGQYASGNNPPLPLQLCALIKRIPGFGRQGSILYRGAVGSPDAVVTPSGTTIVQRRVDEIQSLFNSLLTGIQNAGFGLVMARGRQTVELGTLRRVVGIEVKNDMTFKKLNNRYFDKVRQ
jgi:hypothetical protein